jgi:hypothetical protein
LQLLVLGQGVQQLELAFLLPVDHGHSARHGGAHQALVPLFSGEAPVSVVNGLFLGGRVVESRVGGALNSALRGGTGVVGWLLFSFIFLDEKVLHRLELNLMKAITVRHLLRVLPVALLRFRVLHVLNEAGVGHICDSGLFV